MFIIGPVEPRLADETAVSVSEYLATISPTLASVPPGCDASLKVQPAYGYDQRQSERRKDYWVRDWEKSAIVKRLWADSSNETPAVEQGMGQSGTGERARLWIWPDHDTFCGGSTRTGIELGRYYGQFQWGGNCMAKLEGARLAIITCPRSKRTGLWDHVSLGEFLVWRRWRWMRLRRLLLRLSGIILIGAAGVIRALSPKW
jgi:hypothetical protein